jgi:hypothetical protein
VAGGAVAIAVAVAVAGWRHSFDALDEDVAPTST